MYVPNGPISGPAGLNNVGNPWWTFQPELVLSVFEGRLESDGQSSREINTANTITKLSVPATSSMSNSRPPSGLEAGQSGRWPTMSAR